MKHGSTNTSLRDVIVAYGLVIALPPFLMECKCTELRIKQVGVATDTRHMVGECCWLLQIVVCSLSNQFRTVRIIEYYVAVLKPPLWPRHFRRGHVFHIFE